MTTQMTSVEYERPQFNMIARTITTVDSQTGVRSETTRTVVIPPDAVNTVEIVMRSLANCRSRDEITSKQYLDSHKGFLRHVFIDYDDCEYRAKG